MSTTEWSDIERLRVWVDTEQHLRACIDSPKSVGCVCGLTEARELAKEVERGIAENDMWYRLCATENGELEQGCIRHMGYIDDIQSQLSTAEAERDAARKEINHAVEVIHDQASQLSTAEAERDAAREESIVDKAGLRLATQLLNDQETELTTLRARVEELDRLRVAVDAYLSTYYNPARQQSRELNCAYERWRDSKPPAGTGEEEK